MNSLFDDYLLAQPAKPRAPGIYYVTDLTKSCLRQTYLDIVEPKPHPIETLRIFETGRILERVWVDQVLPLKHRVLSSQLPARYTAEGFSIHGRIDALCQHADGSLVVHECKSAKSLLYTREPKPEHVQQLQFYLNALNVEFGSIDYLDKGVLMQGGDKGGGDQVDKCFTIRREPSSFAAMICRGRELAHLINANEIPVASDAGWICDYCSHRKACGDCLTPESLGGVEK